MKNVKIKYNPFIKTTEVLIDGKKPKSNSSLNFGEKRLQEWAGELPEILVRECQDRNFSIEFTGTLADFEDLKSGLSAPNVGVKIDNYKHNCTPSVSETEEEVDKIFKEIKNGPVPQLRDQSIITAFEKAKNLLFEINVVATMSSGKSTLINALLDKKLMPVAAEATTATIVNIVDTDIDGFRGIAYDSNGEEVCRDINLTYDTMKEWNKNDKISSILIEGRIPCVNSVGMKLVLVDTPGPNNSADKRHKDMTYRMLEDSDKSLVLFVMRADNLGVDDEKAFLDYVCSCMQKGGKQSRDRYIFAINQMDRFNPEEESVENALTKIKNNLEKRGIFNPNIFPVSAQAALEARTRPVVQQVLPVYRQYVKHFPSTHFDSYYKFSHLPILVQKVTDSFLAEATNNPNRNEGEYTSIEIHSGIVSIEKAIELYINKYARTIKVFDLVQSFNNRLKELAVVATLKQEIQENATKKAELDKTIKSIRDKISSGEYALHLTKLLKRIDKRKEVDEEVKKYIDGLRSKIDSIIWEYNNSSEVPKSEAIEQANKVKKESEEVINQVSARIGTIIESNYINLYQTIIKEYESYVKELGIIINMKDLTLNPFDFISTELTNLTSILDDATKPIDKGWWGKEKKKEKYMREKINWVFCPWHWGTHRYVEEEREVEVDKWYSNWKDFVNMSDVVTKIYQPIQNELEGVRNSAITHFVSETDRIKSLLEGQLTKINKALEAKLLELQDAIEDSNDTEKLLFTKKENLEWMNGIINRTNKLINF